MSVCIYVYKKMNFQVLPNVVYLSDDIDCTFEEKNKLTLTTIKVILIENLWNSENFINSKASLIQKGFSGDFSKFNS